MFLRIKVRVLVCGGRDFNNIYAIDWALRALNPSEIIHGGARGADTLAGNWAEANEIPVTVCKANWEKYGKSAGPIRNQEMLELKPDEIVAFPGGRGTKDMVQRALKQGFHVTEISKEVTDQITDWVEETNFEQT